MSIQRIICVSMFLGILHCSYAETYSIRPKLENGFYFIGKVTRYIDTERYLALEENVENRKLISSQRTTIKNRVFYVVSKISNDKIYINITRRNGTIEIEGSGSEKFLCEVENPKHADKLNMLNIKPFVAYAQGGIGFFIDPSSGKVTETWILNPKSYPRKDEKSGRSLISMNHVPSKDPDPYNQAENLKQYPQKEVSINDTWSVTSKFPEYTYKRNYKLVEVKRKKGEKIAKVEITGEIRKENDKIGTIQGHYYFNLDKRVKISSIVDEDMIEETQKNTLTRIHRNSTFDLMEMKQ